MSFPVDLHTHTVASDHAYSTVMELIAQARLKGLKMIALTDHGPDLPDGPHPWHFKNLKVIPRLADGVGVLRGVEANITAVGGLDLEEPRLKSLDIVLAGFHANLLPTTREEHTALLSSVIKSGLADVISHPGTRSYPIDYEEILLLAREYNVAIEINASSSVNSRPGSHDNCVAIGRLAARIGNAVSVGSDAHIAYFLGNFEEALRVIAESGVRREQIINTSPLKVLDFLESRGHAPLPELRGYFAGGG